MSPGVALLLSSFWSAPEEYSLRSEGQDNAKQEEVDELSREGRPTLSTQSMEAMQLAQKVLPRQRRREELRSRARLRVAHVPIFCALVHPSTGSSVGISAPTVTAATAILSYPYCLSLPQRQVPIMLSMRPPTTEAQQ